jgi:hypothetical protein
LRCWLGWLALLSVTAVQVGLTFTLLTPNATWNELVSPAPITAGRHPLHLYHGQLGGQMGRLTGSTCCFDPAFQAGYPKTPWFDAGARPAEALAFVLGRAYGPAAYKGLVAGVCVLVPIVGWWTARGVHLGPLTGALAAGLASGLWWWGPARSALEAGELDMLLGTQLLLLHLAAWVRYERQPGSGAWLSLFLTATFGWWVQPALWLLGTPLWGAFYLRTAPRHPLSWHLGLLAALGLALLCNGEPLTDWVRHWWIRHDDRPVRTALEAWDEAGAAGWWVQGVVAAGGVGVWRLGVRGRRRAAWLFGFALLGVLLVGFAAAWGRWRLGPTPRQLWLLAGSLAVVPAAFAGMQVVRWLQRFRRRPARVGWLGVVVLLVGGIVQVPAPAVWSELPLRVSPLAVGLPPCADAVVPLLKAAPPGRILWEETDCLWTPLLPQLTGRAFLGGLEADLPLDHGYARLRHGVLAGRPLERWTEAELQRFLRRYHISTLAAELPTTVARWQSLPGATLAGRTSTRTLITVPLAERGLLLRGQGRLVRSEPNRLAWADVVPDNGVVILSLHYHPGWRVAPYYVALDRAYDADDPVPFVRLRLPGPVARLTLTWGNE